MGVDCRGRLWTVAPIASPAPATVAAEGAYISRIEEIAATTDSARRNKVVITVGLRGAKKPKLLKIIASEKTSIANDGMEMELPPCLNIRQRILPISIAIFNAWARSERCVSFFGDNS